MNLPIRHCISIIWALVASLFALSCTNNTNNTTTAKDDREFFVVPNSFEPMAIRFDDTVYLYSVPRDARIYNTEQHYNGRSVSYTLTELTDARSTELYFVVFRNDMEDPIAATMAILKQKLKNACGNSNIAVELVNQEILKNETVIRNTLYCPVNLVEGHGKPIEQDIQIRVKGDYIYLAQATLTGNTKMSKGELDLLTNVMVYNKAYPIDTYVEILRTN